MLLLLILILLKTVLANSLSIVLIKGKPVFSNGCTKNPLDCPTLCNWIFDNFILADEPFAKAIWSLRTCVLVDNNLYWRHYYSKLEISKVVDNKSFGKMKNFFSDKSNSLEEITPVENNMVISDGVKTTNIFIDQN